MFGIQSDGGMLKLLLGGHKEDVMIYGQHAVVKLK